MYGRLLEIPVKRTIEKNLRLNTEPGFVPTDLSLKSVGVTFGLFPASS